MTWRENNKRGKKNKTKQKIKKTCNELTQSGYRVNNEDMRYVQGRRLLLVKLVTSSLPDYWQLSFSCKLVIFIFVEVLITSIFAIPVVTSI